MNKKRINRERGQFLVLLVVMMFALLAMLAFVLDGGNIYAKRRTAQNAADAGALAGARTLCMTGDKVQADFMAHQYATVYNGPTVPTVVVSSNAVTVTAKITFNSFFAHMIGIPVLNVTADAAAGCVHPTAATSVLPIAWACRPPIVGTGSTSPDCEERAITQDQLKYYIANPPPVGTIYPELYIIMDSTSTPGDLSQICMSQGGWLQCDLNGDGVDELVANGDRAWLDLNGGGGGASDLSYWIKNGYPGTLDWHTWLGGQPGVANSVFQSVADVAHRLFAIPVFNEFCDGYPSTKCPSEMHAQDVIVTSAGGNYYYHVIGFAGFYVACVDAPGVPGPECPGHKYARDLKIIAANTKTIEGYFVKGILPNVGGGSGGGFDLGVYGLKLLR